MEDLSKSAARNSPAGLISDGSALEKRARADLGWPELVEELAARCHTERGAASARALLPQTELSFIRSRLAEVSEAKALHDDGAPMPFGQIRDVEEVLARAEKGGHLDGPSLRDVASALVAGARLRRHLSARLDDAPRLAGRAALIAELADVSGPIEDAFDDGGQLLDSASPALGGLRRKASALRDELDRRAHALLDHPLIAPHLQDRFYTRRDDRFVLPIRADARTRLKGIVHGTSGSGQTVFVEPEEIVDLNNRLKLAELEVTDEERRILGELTLLVSDASRAIRVNLEILSVLDLIDGGARMSIDLGGREPSISGVDDASGRSGASDQGPVHPDLRLDLRRARHPLMVLSGRTVVPSDIVLRAGHTMIISGPNAGGKTVALKTAGLLSLMVRAGLHIPAQEGSTLPLYRTVLTDVGDDQSLEKNLSTFSAHVLHLNAFLVAAAPSTLLLLDEIAVGTDPEQGAALAQAVLEHFAARGATVIVTTHYERLKTMAAVDARFENASVGFDLEKLEPTFKLHLGVPGGSGAVVVARRLGLPEPVAARAEALVGGGAGEMEKLLIKIDEERQRLSVAATGAEAERAEAEAARRRIDELAVEARDRVKAARKAEHDESVEALRRARIELDRVRMDLRKTGAGERGKETLAEADRAIDRVAGVMKEHAPDGPVSDGRPAITDELLPGTEVLVPKMGAGARGVVASLPRDGRVAVQLGALKLSVEVTGLLIPRGGKSAGAQATAPATGNRGQRSHRSEATPATTDTPGLRAEEPRTAGNTLDLRGERVDAALALAEKFLDEALQGHQEIVYLVHGHGTGALKSALRDHLTNFPGVSSLRPGAASDGGDGVTIVLLS